MDYDVLEEVISEVGDGEISINDARERLGYPPVEGGDNRLIIENGLVVGIITPQGERLPPK